MVWAVSAVAAWAGGVAAGAAFTVGVTGYAYAAVYYGVTALVGTALSSALAGALIPGPDSSGAGQAQQGILLNTTSTVDAIPVIYGFRRYGGTLVFCEVSDKSGSPGTWADSPNAYLHLVVVHCEGEIKADVGSAVRYLNGESMSGMANINYLARYGTDAQTAVSYLVDATAYTFGGTYSQSGTTVTITATAHKRTVGESVTLDYTSGTAVDGAFTIVSVPTDNTFTVTAAGSLTTSGNVTATGNKWGANHKLSGLAYTWVMIKYDREKWSNVPVLTADLYGRKCYDPRTSTTIWSDNPAIVIRDYLINARFGRGILATDIDDASIIAAANHCDGSVSTPTGTQKRYTFNGIINTGRPALDNLRDMLATCRGILVFSGGKYKLIIDQATSPTFTFTEDNIVGGWNIKLGDKRSRYNRVRASWVDPERDWQPTITVRDSTSYRTADNGLMLEAQIEYPYVTDPYQIQRLADMHLKQSRFGTACSFRATIAGMLCEVGDVVNITHATPGWTNKPFRIQRISLLDSDEVEVTCTEYDASVYTPNTLTVPRVSMTTNLPTYGTPPAPTSLTLASGDTHRLINPDGIVTPRAHASWTASADARINQYEVQFKKTTESAYISRFVPAAETATYLDGVQYNVTYDVRVRAVNDGGFSSAWASSTIYVTASPSQPNDLPIDVQTFTSSGTWTKPSRGRVALIECWGGGGSGGAGIASGGGGGGGLYASLSLQLSSLGATETVTLGAGGAAVTHSTVDLAGNSGGNTTFGALLTAYGGQGGGAGTVTLPSNPGGGGGGASQGGVQYDSVGKNGAGSGGMYLNAVWVPAIASPVAGGGGAAYYGITGKGGDSTYGGGGGSGCSSPTPAAAGVSAYGGNGGIGAYGGTAGSGVQPGGGGGGVRYTTSGTSGAGGAGKCRVTVW